MQGHVFFFYHVAGAEVQKGLVLQGILSTGFLIFCVITLLPCRESVAMVYGFRDWPPNHFPV